MRRSLDIEIHMIFPGMRTHANGVYFLGALVIDPGVQHVLGKYVAFEQEVVVLFQGQEALIPANREPCGCSHSLFLLEVQ